MAQDDTHQQHPLAIYFWIWGLLFVLSTFSYMVLYRPDTVEFFRRGHDRVCGAPLIPGSRIFLFSQNE